MELYERRPVERSPSSDPSQDWNPAAAETGLEESMWPLELGGRDSYPERPGEPDCDYYIRTGFCGYGARCRFNHPRDSSVVAGAVRHGAVYPERFGQPVCQYFLKTGTCRFGATCKYHHPRYESGSMSTMSLNYYGYPLRPGEKECSYYVKMGQCKFGVTCKFHHPQPAGISMPAAVPPFYPMVQTPSVPSPQYGGIAGWPVARPPLVASPYLQGLYAPVLLSPGPGMVSIHGWSPYPPAVSPLASNGAQQTVGMGSQYGLTYQLSPSAPAYPGPYSTLSSAAGPSTSNQKEHVFPERPGQPECLFYIKTGDCKFGSSCKYHHPPEWGVPKTNCLLSPMGLPLRLGAQPCTFYAQHGVCKFGPTCKFDHPMRALSYSPSTSSLADMPVAPYPVGSSLATLAPSSSSTDLRIEFVGGSNKDSFTSRIPSSEASSGSVGSIFSRGGLAQSRVQSSGRSSVPSSGSSNAGHGGGNLSSS